MSKPMLTIGIIFKDNIRSIERCLKALQPLRDSVSCELVMADTGSTDGSRQVAERYADILFDFPWIDDFSAARNAVMDRASGKWFFTVDSDEYLDEDVSGLKAFLAKVPKDYDVGSVIQRNYQSYEMDDAYNDFYAVRLLRMSTGIRYQGKIHEVWHKKSGKLYVAVCPGTILHHDGYVELREADSEKRKRNLTLLREKIKNEPENLMGWLQLIESSGNEMDYWYLVNQATALVEEKKRAWEIVGPPIIRYGVIRAASRHLPETDEWIQRAETMFPESLFTRIDVQFIVCSRLWEAKDYAGFIAHGEDYLKAMDDYRADKDLRSRMTSSFQMVAPAKEQEIKLYLASSCAKEGQPERALELLKSIEIGKLKVTTHLEEFVIALREIHGRSFLDTAPLLTAVWEDVIAPESSAERRGAFLRPCGAAFVKANRESERQDPHFCRPAWTMLLPLAEQCELGRAAAVMEVSEPALLAQKLAAVENWAEFPAAALAYALECGAAFPLPEKQMGLEEMDTLAGRLFRAEKEAVQFVMNLNISGPEHDLQYLCWARALTLAAVQAFPWAGEDAEAETGLSLARTFAQTEKAFLPLCYAPGALSENGLFLLPPMHRFGWYCAQAFDLLDAGDVPGYVRLLRTGLGLCGTVKDMVKFLQERTPEIQAHAPADELDSLAEHIRTMLSKFSPDDPAVTALKQSEAYQKVAHLIEGAAVPVVGGLVQ